MSGQSSDCVCGQSFATHGTESAFKFIYVQTYAQRRAKVQMSRKLKMWLTNLPIFLIYLTCVVAGHGDYSKGHYKWVDLTYALNNDTVLYPGKKSLLGTEHEGEMRNGDWLASKGFCISEHTGTHIDSPYHFIKNGRTLSEIPLENMLDIPGVCVDVYDKIHKFTNGKLDVISNYVVTKNDLVQWEEKNGMIPAGSVVLLRTGWGQRWPNAQDYIGIPSDKTNLTDLNFLGDPDKPYTFSPFDVKAGSFMNFPGFDASAAKFLVSERNVNGAGIDTLSLDPGNSKEFPAHKIFLKNNVFLLENLANLHTLPPNGFKVYVVPFKVDKGTGAPTRVVAKVPVNPGRTELCDYDP